MFSWQNTLKNSGKRLKKALFCLKNIGLFRYKHPYFPYQTSELFPKKSDVFVLMAGNDGKNL